MSEPHSWNPCVSRKPAGFQHWTCNVDDFRQQFESDKHWSARRQFIIKHIEEYERNGLDKLLALSMVWVNHVFLGCRYGSQLMDRVLEMAEGIDVGEMPSFELVPNAEAKKRPYSSDESGEPMKKMPVSKFTCRPRFEPIHFVSGESSGSGNGGTDEKENEKDQGRDEMNDVRIKEPDHQPYIGSRGLTSHSGSLEMGSYGDDEYRSIDMPSGGSSGLGYGSRGSTSNFMSKMQQAYTAKYEAHNGRQYDSISQSGRVDESSSCGRSGAWDSGWRGYGHQDNTTSNKSFSKVYDSQSRGDSGLLPTPSLPASIPPATLDTKQRLIARVSSAIAVTLRDPTFMSKPGTPNYNFILSRSIQACKTNPEYIYVNLKDIPPADLPKNRKALSEGYACELRCQGVYLATGYSGSKNGARDRASEQAVKLFMRAVEVRVVQRLFKRKFVNDLVVCLGNTPNPTLPPPLRNPENKPPPNTKGQYEPDQSKHWTEFIIMENAHDAICKLNNSAAFNRMKVDYTFDPVPSSNLWLCSVYLQGELVAQASGTKKSSKHLAAEEAVKKLLMNQAARQQEQQHFSGGNYSSEDAGGCYSSTKSQLGKLVILENSDNAICIINDTAQFNKVVADYRFTVLQDLNWQCEVYLDGQYVATGIGPKKTVKHIAAEEALATLRRTQAVVKSNLWKVGHEDAISRDQIMGRSAEEQTRHVIKEDNIGNQLLRKMGWTGGGLGREGDGIAEPIKVKEQFTREGLGMDRPGGQLTKRDIEDIIRNYASSGRSDDLRFSTELHNEERRQIHQVSQRYGLRSKSYGQGRQRFLVVSRKVQKEELLGQLLQEGQVGHYELVKPQAL